MKDQPNDVTFRVVVDSWTASVFLGALEESFVIEDHVLIFRTFPHEDIEVAWTRRKQKHGCPFVGSGEPDIGMESV